MDHLLRGLAPVTDETWIMLDDEARARLTPALGGRKLVDFVGPLGWEHSATSIGRVGPVIAAPLAPVIARRRSVLPLAEVRVDFTLARAELDAAARGAIDVDLSALDTAAADLATAENSAIFTGWEPFGFAGVIPSTPNRASDRSDDPRDLARQVAGAMAELKRAGVDGPYGLAVDSDTWVNVIGGSDEGGSPLLRHLEKALGGPVEWAPGVDGAVVLSLRGGDYVFESGQDISIGYSHHDGETVSFYLEETFSFRVATPEAAAVVR